MRQHSIDLLPDSIRLRCQARVRTGQTIGAFAAVIGSLVLIISYGKFEVTQSQRELGLMREQANIVLGMEERALELGTSYKEANEYLSLYQSVAPPVDVSSVLATIINELPESVSLDRIDIDAGARVRIRTSRSRGAPSSSDDGPAPRMLNCEIAGFAASDEQVAEIVDRLRAQEPFDRVSLDFSRSRMVRETSAREFRLSCRIDLEQLYEVSPQESVVATAEGATN